MLRNKTLAEAHSPHTGLWPPTEKDRTCVKASFRNFSGATMWENSKHDSQFEPGTSRIWNRHATLTPSVVTYSWRSNKRGEINRFLAQIPPTLQHCYHPRFFNPHSSPGRLASRALASAPLSPRDQLHDVWGRGGVPRADGRRGGIQGVVRHVSRGRGMGCRTQIELQQNDILPFTAPVTYSVPLHNLYRHQSTYRPARKYAPRPITACSFSRQKLIRFGCLNQTLTSSTYTTQQTFPS